MLILGLDLATRTGFACGKAGERPDVGVVELKARGEGPEVAYGNLIAWLNTTLARTPDLVVKEAPPALQGFARLGNAAATVRMTYGMHGIVEGMCARFGIRCEEVAASKVRKHFLGAANMGDRATTKRAVIERCHLLGLLPRDCHEDNKADAIAVFDWASATFARRHFGAHELRLFVDARVAG